MVASMKLRFCCFWVALEGRNHENAAQLLDLPAPVCLQAGYRCRSVFGEGDLTANSLETENKHIKNGLINHSSALNGFLVVFDRMNFLKQNDIFKAGNAMVSLKACDATEWLEHLLCKTSGGNMSSFTPSNVSKAGTKCGFQAQNGAERTMFDHERRTRVTVLSVYRRSCRDPISCLHCKESMH